MYVTIDDFNPEKINFCEIESKTIPNTLVDYKKIKIKYEDHDFLLLSPDDLLSLGLYEKISESNNLTGYQLSVLLWSKYYIRKEEELFISVLNKITEKIISYLLEIKKHICKNELTRQELEKINPIYYKLDKESSPMLFLKCFYNKFNEEIETIFVDEEDRKQVNPLMCLQRKMNTKLCIKIDSIFITPQKISIQMKLSQCFFKRMKQNVKSLLYPHIDLTTWKSV